MTLPVLQSLAQLSVARIVNSVPEGLLIALFAWALLRVTGRQNSGTRFVIWFSALTAIVVLPFVGGLRAAHLNTPAILHPEIVLPASWATVLFMGWFLLAMLALVRVGFGLHRIRELRRSCVPLALESFDPSIRELVQQHSRARAVTVSTSDLVSVPTAVGFLKPTVVLPQWSVGELSAEELKVVLLHELAHLRRWDDWTNLIQKIARAVFFFHPVVWWIERRLSLEREMACDDTVLSHTGNARAYAECLVSLTEKSLFHRGLAMAQAAVHRMKETSLRVVRILNRNGATSTRAGKFALASMSGFLVVCTFTMPHVPELVGFEDTTPALAARLVVPPVVTATESQPIVVPASFHPRVAEMKTVPERLRVKTRPPVATSKEQVIPATVKVAPDRESAVVQTGLRTHSAVPPMLLLVESTTYMQSEGVVWRISVVRWTMIPRIQVIESGIPPKSI
jgi:beta-lactamase regulating signal transducer with metallopeptidase domain